MIRFRISLGFFVFAQGLVLSAAGIAPAASSPQQIPDGRQAAKPSIGDVLRRTILEGDVAAAIREYRRLKAESPDAYDFAEERLNQLGLDLIGKERIKDAIEIFKLNVEAYPQAFNTHDSLGYAYMCDGRRDLAVLNYRKSVELNPDNLQGRRYAYVLERYHKKEYLIPMRDGVKLFT